MSVVQGIRAVIVQNEKAGPDSIAAGQQHNELYLDYPDRFAEGCMQMP